MIDNISSSKVFSGWHKQYSHQSSVLNSAMRFAIYLPPQASESQKVPVLYWLSGLTCSDENFMQKAGAFKAAAELGIAIVAPDTSPRGEEVADDDAYDLGQGAGFYVNAIQAPWQQHYQMYDYISAELPELIEANFPVLSDKSIAGHSMGGHGALVIGLRNPEQYKSISAFSPICNPMNCPWGVKAFTAYLGSDKSLWQQYDASALITQHNVKQPIMIEQGLADQFLAEQLNIEQFADAAKKANYPVEINQHEGYDHSYYFIASFIEKHLAFHSKALLNQ
ncbi:S-formylglutathione hydrolase [Litorilituus lipolyticus]|uniref:S-formylglutathione hydrolase n=1 Tax=Litorilituus lipolyticus TaxID=2491017 RepID=A0A502L5S1_9GAMM|nr:S-formylglutathione hydrolase [Litorilituus lipolyticus]TPH19270.1 S-formylglutathione hydrolase [Litorilituus lipolyticus]